MSPQIGVRPGGRSARVQQAVHDAVRELLAERERDELTVPLIAARAGVTPSTVYRRWGQLPDLYADVAVERLRPDTSPADLGSLEAELDTWAVQYLEEMASGPGRRMIADVLAGGLDNPRRCLCSTYSGDQIQVMLDRAVARGDDVPDRDTVLDRVVAPIVYRILFTDPAPEPGYATRLVADLLAVSPAKAGPPPERADRR
ncbi:TetR/AcrR family transcriptional regulator [Actinoplanes couchii]|uniref:TetR family transcriptional regulator n=1 Tax=Actinoplanes couchii TaxID=403638 RepID=A0ABQ3XBD4_9ACTN|nr:TetR/AcrR family transcriptional regulator [Actinoplanes couchii]MDR6323259.1 AcrR family transcriptional regulator [Actinoplanes couchii]GID55773.1 TetR family transcriptional regulator [Actinoplanes couchii]